MAELAYAMDLKFIGKKLAGSNPALSTNIEVSPSGKATDFDSVMRRFKPCYLCQSIKIKKGKEKTMETNSEIKRIRTVSDSSVKFFDRKVNKLLSDGWQLTNISVLPSHGKIYYVASLISFEDAVNDDLAEYDEPLMDEDE